MIQDVGNVELFELFETDPKTQCKACLSYWSEGIVYWHYDTITIGPEGKFNWVLQLINSQKAKLFDSHEEKFNTQRSPN